MDDDGSNLTLLTEEFKPYPRRWSPDGKQILFGRRGNPLNLMNADGTHIQQLIKDPDVNTTILGGSFSPDGKSIVFSRDFVVNKKERNTLTVMDIATREMKIIAEVDASTCDWSPDGKLIVFDKPMSVGGNEGTTIWMTTVKGHKPLPLIPVRPGTNRLKPRWSPNGKRVAFLQREFSWQEWPGLNGRTLIYHAHRYVICDRNGENITKLSIPKDYEGSHLTWMDNGDSIVFTAIAGAPIDEPVPRGFLWPPSYVYKYHIPTGDITQLTNNPGWDQTLDWISDDVLSITPQEKKKVTWGEIKQ